MSDIVLHRLRIFMSAKYITAKAPENPAMIRNAIMIVRFSIRKPPIKLPAERPVIQMCQYAFQSI